MSLNDTAELQFGDVRLQLAAPYAVFGGSAEHWEVGKGDGRAWLDVVLYEGEPRTFNLAELDEAVVGIVVRLGTAAKGSLEVQAAVHDGRLQMKCGPLALELPVRPDRGSVLQKAFNVDL